MKIEKQKNPQTYIVCLELQLHHLQTLVVFEDAWQLEFEKNAYLDMNSEILLNSLLKTETYLAK